MANIWVPNLDTSGILQAQRLKEQLGLQKREAALRELSVIPQLLDMTREVSPEGEVATRGMIPDGPGMIGGGMTIEGRRKADPSRRVQYRTLSGQTLDREFLSSDELSQRVMDRKIIEARTMAGETLAAKQSALQALGLPVTVNGETRYIEPGTYDDFQRGETSRQAAAAVKNQPPVTIPGAEGYGPVQASQFGGLASLYQVLNPAPRWSQTINRDTGDVMYTGVDPKTRQPITVSSPDWQGATQPRPRQSVGGRSGGGGQKPTTTQAIDNLTERALQDSAAGGGTEIDHAIANLEGDNYGDVPKWQKNLAIKKLRAMKTKEPKNPYAKSANPQTEQAAITYTESQVRERARARGINEDAAVEQARKNNLLR